MAILSSSGWTRLAFPAAVAGALAMPRATLAQPTNWSGDPRNTATAQALFDQARDEMKDGHFAEACPKLEEAIRLEPSGAGAKLKLAECYEGAGRLASAFATYVVAETAARAAGRTDRASWAAERAAALKPRLSTLTLSVAESAKGQEGLSLRRDGREIGRAEWGVGVPVDGGTVVVVAEAPGHIARTWKVDVRAEGDAATVVIEPLEAEPASAPAPEPTPPPEAVAAPPPRAVAPRAAPTAEGPHVPTWAWVTGGVGLASGLVGVGFRVDGVVVEADQADACGPARERCPRGYDVDGTNSRKLLDFGMFVGLGSAGAAALGIALVGAAVGLSEDEPGEKETAWSVSIAPTSSGLGVSLSGAL